MSKQYSVLSDAELDDCFDMADDVQSAHGMLNPIQQQQEQHQEHHPRKHGTTIRHIHHTGADVPAPSETPSTEACTEDELFGMEESTPTLTKLMIISKQSAPVIISFFLGLLGSFINLLFAGRFIPTEGDRNVDFAGISLANMFANVTCLSLLIGMSSAVETLGSQHNGAGNYEKVGLVLQRSFAVLFAMTLPMLVLWYYVYDIYTYIGVDHEVCEVIKNYIYIRALGVPIDVINESYEKYLMSIGVMEPAMWSNVSFNIFILTFNSLFVFGFGWGYRSLAFSWVLSTYLSSFVQIGLSFRYATVMRTLQPWDRRAFTDWWEYIQLGLPGTIMLCSEWWAFECLMLFATFLGTPQVAAQTIILQISSMSFMVPLGIGVTCASFVGNAIGAGKIGLAKQIGKLSLLYTAMINTLCGGLILLVGDQFVAIFTSDPSVQKVTESAIPFLSLFIMIDGLQGVASGVLRGAGKQYIGAVANVIAYYGAGLPMAYVVCFVLHFGVDGLMMGISIGSLIQVTVLFTMIFVFETYLYDTNIVTRKGAFQALSGEEDVEFGARDMSLLELVQKHAHTSNGSASNSNNGSGGDSVGFEALARRTTDHTIDVSVDDCSSGDEGTGVETGADNMYSV